MVALHLPSLHSISMQAAWPRAQAPLNPPEPVRQAAQNQEQELRQRM